MCDKHDMLAKIATEVLDADEETYYLFSHEFPQRHLGMIDGQAAIINVEIAGIEYELRQSPGLLTSPNSEGTTGAALWKISPIVAEWLQDTTTSLWSSHILHSSAVVIELGCGITGLLGLVLAKHIGKYILTDQQSVLKVLQANVDANTAPVSSRKGKQAAAAPTILRLNWETDYASILDDTLDSERHIDAILICDCVFNDFLIQPLVNMCKEISQRTNQTPTLIIAQQLRSNDIFTTFMETLMQHFSVWRLNDHALSPSLKNGTGFVVHVAVLRPSDNKKISALNHYHPATRPSQLT